MELQVKVVSIEHDATIAKNGGGSYKGTRIAYRDAEGSLKEKNIHSNALKFNPALKNQLAEIKAGDDITIEMVKEGEFWNVKNVKKGFAAPVSNGSNVAGASNGNGGAVQSPRSTYETAEERAKKQVYIVRQSSITQALTYFGLIKGIDDTFPTTDEILGVASRFEAHVFGTEFDDGTLAHLPKDEVE